MASLQYKSEQIRQKMFFLHELPERVALWTQNNFTLEKRIEPCLKGAIWEEHDLPTISVGLEKWQTRKELTGAAAVVFLFFNNVFYSWWDHMK